MIENAEELWQRCRRLKKEEEEEDREIGLYYQRLGYMLEHCAENDRDPRIVRGPAGNDRCFVYEQKRIYGCFVYSYVLSYVVYSDIMG